VKSARTDICEDLLEKLTTCRLNAPKNQTTEDISTDDTTTDDFFTVCSDCVAANNFFEQYDKESCADATKEVCSFYSKCNNECFATYAVCSDEAKSFDVCFFGATGYAPENCVVTCEEAEGGGGGGGGGGSLGSPIEDENGISAGSLSAKIAALSLSTISFVIAVGLYF
jgi:hypothetical protein